MAMAYTLSEAAQAVGRGKTTLLRMIKQGKLSAARDPVTDGWLVEPAELHRLYPPASREPHRPAHHSEPRIADLKARLEARDSLIAAHERTIEDLRRRLDSATETFAEALQQMRQLTDERPRKRWWRKARVS